jgi:hypothetical protein
MRLKYLSIVLVLSVFLTGCDIENQLKTRIDPITASFQARADDVQKYIKSLAGDESINDDPNLLTSVNDTTSLVTDVAGLQDTLFNNPEFLSLTPITPTIQGTIPISYYAAAPQPVRATAYAMDQLEPGAGQSMSALGMVSWLALAVSLPFTMMRSLTATTTYLGPLGMLLSWVTIAGLWFIAVLTLDFIVSITRNSGGLIRIFISVVRLFK